MSTQKKVLIGIINGSLRQASKNSGLSRVVQSHSPHNVEIVPINISHLPLMNQDLQVYLDGGKTVSLPGAVTQLRSIVRNLDALLFSSPQNNGAVSAALKNAYDWLSRDYTRFGGKDTSPMNERMKLGVVGASYISEGGLKDVRRMVEYNKVRVFEQGYYQKLGQSFDESGELVNEEQKKLLGEWAKRFYNWVEQNN